MAQGPGKYDDILTAAREMCGPLASAVLIVFNGKFGSGFSVQCEPEMLLILPDVLRQTAEGIEATLKEGRL